MLVENRVNEILSSMQSFSKEAYGHKEMLEELLNLQDEIVSLTFNEEHAASANLRIMDVVKHLESLNKQSGYAAGRSFDRFKAGAKSMSDQIKAGFSGKRGENMAFYSLRRMKTNSSILRNIELGGDDFHSEIDVIVIKPGQINIIEVKNTKKDVFINERSDYYTTGCYVKKNYNIGYKLNIKQQLVREALAGLNLPEVPIRSFVVFTNEDIEIHNKSPWVKTVFVGQLPEILDEQGNSQLLTDIDMQKVASTIKDAEIKREYPADFDVDQFKRDYAMVMASLESHAECTSEEDRAKDSWIKVFFKKYSRPIGAVSFGLVMGFEAVRSINRIRSFAHKR